MQPITLSSVILPFRPILEVIKLKVQRHRYAKCPPSIDQRMILSPLSPSLHVQLSHLIPTIKDTPLTSRVTAARRIEVRKLDVPNIAPVIDVLPIIVSIVFPVIDRLAEEYLQCNSNTCTNYKSSDRRKNCSTK